MFKMCIREMCLLVAVELLLFHASLTGKCSLSCNNVDERFCCTCERQLYDSRCFISCLSNDENCIRRCYAWKVMYNFDYYSCFGCDKYRNSFTGECMSCPGTCLSCLNNTFCLDCKKGFYGDSCDKKCGHCKTFHSVQSECDIENGICIEGCSDGYYGHTCENICGNCLPNELGAVKCEKETGNCILGCADSYYGKKCDRKCNNCLPDKEGKVICDMNTGFCLNNCTEEYFGNACNEKCSINCLASKSSGLSVKCDKVSGNCIYGCVPGWYGKNCNKPCNITCTRRSCIQNTGSCIDGCIPGWYGDTCNKPCSSPCYNKTCMQKSGHCRQGCVLGWYGVTCSKQCRSSCYYNSCIQKSGHCSVGCMPGWYGDTCNKPCSSFCSNRSCIQSSGYCKHGCVPGWYGVTCGLHCPGTCKKQYCDRSTSECVNGCDAGFSGLFCNMNHTVYIKKRRIVQMAQELHVCKRNAELCNSVAETSTKETIKNDRNSSFDGMLGSLAGSIILIVIVFIVLATRRIIIGKKNNASCEAQRTIYDEISDRNVGGLEQREDYLYIDTGNTYDSVRSLNDSDSNSLSITGTCLRSSIVESLTGINTDSLCQHGFKTTENQCNCNEPKVPVSVTISSFTSDKDESSKEINLNGSTENSSVKVTFSTCLSEETYDSNNSDGYITPLYVQANDIENSDNDMKEDAIEMVHVGKSDSVN